MGEGATRAKEREMNVALVPQDENSKVFTISEYFVPKGKYNEDGWRVEAWQFINGSLHALHRDIFADPATDPASIKVERKEAAEWCAGQLALCRASKCDSAIAPVVFAAVPDVPPNGRYELVAK